MKRKSRKKNRHIQKNGQLLNLGKEWRHLSNKQQENIMKETYDFYDKLSPNNFSNDKERRLSAITASYISFSDKGGWCNWRSFYLKLNSKIIRRNSWIALEEKKGSQKRGQNEK